MLAQETVLNLFDSYWFQYEIFTSNSKPPLHSTVLEPNQDPKLNRVTTLMRKSYSDQFLSSKDSDSSESPNPIPKTSHHHLQTILSGKETEGFQDSESRKQESIFKDTKRMMKRRKSGSKSLTELEIEELKGFMDLGFVFSDEEKEDSRLVSIIPGLLKIGKNIDINITVEEISDKGSSISRPYLSEAWDNLGDQKRINMKNWKIPAFGNEIELKDHLRFWAHTVASTVV